MRRPILALTARPRATTSLPRAGLVLACAALGVLTTCSSLAAGSRAGSDPEAFADLQALQSAFEQIVQRVAPSVVGVRTRRVQAMSFLEDQAQEAGRAFEQIQIINGAGSILTNEHLLRGAVEVEVILHDGSVHAADIVATDPRSDLAVIRVPGFALPAVPTCDWSSVRRGQWSLALGNPFGLGSDGRLSVSVGVISNLERALPGLGEVDDRLYADMIQTTAAIHPGNSGGPLLNIRGELVGVVTAVHARGIDDQGVGFAIPINPARQRIIEQLLEGRCPEHGYLGVTVRELLEEEQAGAGPSGGVLVEDLDPDGPAAKAGVRRGDILSHYNDQAIIQPLRLAELVDQTVPGQIATLRLRRGGQPLALTVTVGRREPSRVQYLRGSAILWRGLRLTEVTPLLRERLRIPHQAQGLVVLAVQNGSSGARAGLKVGDVIDQVAQTPITDGQSFLELVRGEAGAIRVHVWSRGEIQVEP
jgi:serine protease Do